MTQANLNRNYKFQIIKILISLNNLYLSRWVFSTLVYTDCLVDFQSDMFFDSSIQDSSYCSTYLLHSNWVAESSVLLSFAQEFLHFIRKSKPSYFLIPTYLCHRSCFFFRFFVVFSFLFSLLFIDNVTLKLTLTYLFKTLFSSSFLQYKFSTPLQLWSSI